MKNQNIQPLWMILSSTTHQAVLAADKAACEHLAYTRMLCNEHPSYIIITFYVSVLASKQIGLGRFRLDIKSVVFLVWVALEEYS